MNDELLEKVPRLAICENLGDDIGPVLFHCDEKWRALGTSGANTVAKVKVAAEQNYPGVASRWVDMNITVEAALVYYDSQSGNLRCSFCGKRSFEVMTWIKGKAAIICGNCVTEFHRDLKSDSSSTSS